MTDQHTFNDTDLQAKGQRDPEPHERPWTDRSFLARALEDVTPYRVSEHARLVEPLLDMRNLPYPKHLLADALFPYRAESASESHFKGIPIVADPSMPKNRAEIRNPDGTVQVEILFCKVDTVDNPDGTKTRTETVTYRETEDGAQGRAHRGHGDQDRPRRGPQDPQAAQDEERAQAGQRRGSQTRPGPRGSVSAVAVLPETHRFLDRIGAGVAVFEREVRSEARYVVLSPKSLVAIEDYLKQITPYLFGLEVQTTVALSDGQFMFLSEAGSRIYG